MDASDATPPPPSPPAGPSPSAPPPAPAPAPSPEWFDRPAPATPDNPDGEPGLRFGCTMCGNCCTGPEGFVLVNTPEVDALAARLGLSREDFVARYTKLVPEGLSLRDVPTTHGFDCVFLDRTTVPGKAVCGVYEDRPRQCRTWPFWTSVLRTEAHWRNANRTCPGIDKGTFYPADKIRILRAVVDI